MAIQIKQRFPSYECNTLHIETIIHLNLLNNFSFGTFFIFILVPHTDALETTQKWKLTHSVYMYYYMYMCVCVYIGNIPFLEERS